VSRRPGPDNRHADVAAQDQREVVGYEVVVRFFPGSGVEAHRYWTQLGWPDDQVQWVRLDRIVVPDGEERVREGLRSRS
jgi:hypothetical protein